MVTYGFFNSLNHDRRYSASEFAQLFDGILTDGVYPDVGDEFKVTTPSDGMKIVVGSGRAWLNHTWTYNDYALPFVLDASEPSITRIDAVVIEVNHDIRSNSIKILKGPDNSSTRPTWTDTETVKTYPIAYITIPATTTEITEDMIQNVVGIEVDDDTPTTPKLEVNQSVDNSDIENITTNWRVQFESYFSQWSNQKNEEFNTFISTLVNHLSSSEIGAIQAEILNKEDAPFVLSDILLEGQQSLEFEDNRINDDCFISVFSDPYGISLVNSTQTGNKIKLEFRPLSHDTIIEVLVRNQ